MEGRVILHFDFFSAEGGPGFDFVEGERKEKGGGVHTIGKEKGGLGWVFIWGEKRGGWGAEKGRASGFGL